MLRMFFITIDQLRVDQLWKKMLKLSIKLSWTNTRTKYDIFQELNTLSANNLEPFEELVIGFGCYIDWRQRIYPITQERYELELLLKRVMTRDDNIQMKNIKNFLYNLRELTLEKMMRCVW